MSLVLGLLELVGYREWTESLGPDREWSIQVLQSRLYSELQRIAALREAFLVPLSIDNMVLVLNGVPQRYYREIYEEAAGLAPVPVGLTVICSRDPVIDLYPQGEPGLRVRTGSTGGNVAALHVDMDYFSGLRERAGSIASYVRIIDFYSRLSKRLSGTPSIATYLGGDNLLVFTAEEAMGRVLSVIRNIIGGDDYKIGVGIARTPRRALAGAAKALAALREKRGGGSGRVEVVAEE